MLTECFLRYVFLVIRRPPRTKRTDTLFTYTSLFRSSSAVVKVCCPAGASDEMAWVRSPFWRNSLIAIVAVAGTGAWLSLDNFAQTHGFLINRPPSLPNWAYLSERGQRLERGEIVFGSDERREGKGLVRKCRYW